MENFSYNNLHSIDRNFGNIFQELNNQKAINELLAGKLESEISRVDILVKMAIGLNNSLKQHMIIINVLADKSGMAKSEIDRMIDETLKGGYEDLQ